MHLLAGRLKHYDWGSTTAIADLRGIEPSGEPEAELWFDSDALPYLVKVLAVQRTLSLQAHPGSEQARRGFEAEEAAGIPIDQPDRSFVDDRAKPELVCAVTPFEALCGFRPVEEATEVAATLGLASELVAVLDDDGTDAWPALVEEALGGYWDGAVDILVDTCATGVDGPFADVADLVVRLADQHPGDPALLVVPLLVHHRLRPGEALYVCPGVLHAYVAGMAVEVMAPGDNVLRGGLTTKHVNATALVEALDPVAGSPLVQVPAANTADLHRYDVPIDDFAVWRLVGTAVDIDERIGPDLVLSMAATTTVCDLVLRPGQAALVSESDGPYKIETDGIVYLVNVGAT
ncbi:MAG: mannose-6-phosphate isomerase, class I [Acidimicrobiales bacterium]|nr:mannose-6-phosphate isomerase, class I [Planctomycetaceae bacterium]MDP6078297.1 mannose-6-phosphate isomerase, class I [Acidimicrobiales bacterium]MDP7258240.1 mannose-6-phosphate isomerase, class I [Acidimicrobiales bacterium]HJO80194.1 mannose-6-phosphate isomerase, class I [Acidimicrobiales bacterium]